MTDELAQIEQRLQACTRLEDVQLVVKTAARRLAGSDGSTLVLLDGDHVYYADEDSMSPLWKGQRFPVSACISGWAIMHRETVVLGDIRTDERIPQEAYQPTFVRSLVMTPMLDPAPVGAIGAYWSTRGAPAREAVHALEQLAGLAAVALERFPERIPDPSFRLGRADTGVLT
ncbi:GAF domain-containing protein [Mycobacterium sp. B14F4]|uniref:GAF domain-containing protein n=1 Tax=Mycobacterium sp. B14F4 TaxID=3153565 RepID=UPI00325CD23F